MKTQFEILRKTRELAKNLVADLSLDQLNTIPEGFKNNIAWNLTHLLVTQQLLHYRLTGNVCLISEDLIETYRKGTQPSVKVSEEEWTEVIEQFKNLPSKLEEDYNSNLFKVYQSYETSTGFVIDSIDTAIQFNNFHESLHLGIMMSIKKLVR